MNKDDSLRVFFAFKTSHITTIYMTVLSPFYIQHNVNAFYTSATRGVLCVNVHRWVHTGKCIYNQLTCFICISWLLSDILELSTSTRDSILAGTGLGCKSITYICITSSIIVISLSLNIHWSQAMIVPAFERTTLE